jgi:predicted ArsR family transcriptional regulator
MSRDPRARARDRVLVLLKQRGPLSAAALARRLGISRVAVRQHLAALASEALVSYREQRGAVGRPARLWQATPVSSPALPDAHAEAAVELLTAARSSFGEAGLDRILGRRTRAQLARYRERSPDPGTPLELRVAALAALRTEEGYMAEWRYDGDGDEDRFLLLENHCAVCAAAHACPGLCREELSLFRRLLGRNVTVERTDHLLSGAPRCGYRIRARTAARRPRRARLTPALGRP